MKEMDLLVTTLLLMPSSEVPVVMISPAMDLETHSSAKRVKDRE
jgi:hypothetical protein